MSFLQDFMLRNAGNECPRPYVLWAGYGLLSATMGRRIFLDLGDIYVDPSIYILIVGETGSKKTAALDIGLDILTRAVPDIVLAGDNETYQGIISYMDSDNSTRFYTHHATGQQVPYKPYCIMASELMDYLQLNAVAMVTFLTGIYGRKVYRYHLKNEDRLLENPYVMMCACTTPRWLTDQVKAKQFAEGYGRRCIIVCADPMPRKWPELKPEHLEAGARCVARLRAIQRITGPMTLAPDAFEWFKTWRNSIPRPDDYFLRNWYSTLDINALKVAMLTSVSERDDRLITLPYVQLAVSQLKETEAQLPMVTSRLGRSELVEPALHVLDIIKNHSNKYPEKQLKIDTLKDFRDTREQWQVIEWLVQTDQLTRMKDTNEKVWLVRNIPAK
jgi:hypothetical protein